MIEIGGFNLNSMMDDEEIEEDVLGDDVPDNKSWNDNDEVIDDIPDDVDMDYKEELIEDKPYEPMN